MELKVKETQNERNFYKAKYQEQEEVIRELRNVEINQSVQIASVQEALSRLQAKY